MINFDNFSHKQLLLFASVIGILFIGVLIIMISTLQEGTTSNASIQHINTPLQISSTNQPKKHTLESNSQTSALATITPLPSISLLVFWNQYNTQYFRIKFPPSFEAIDQSVGTFPSVIFQEKLSYVDPTNATLAVVIYPDSKLTLKERESTFLLTGKAIILGKVAFSSFTFNSPIISGGKSYGNPWIETHYLTQKGSSQIEIITKYQKGNSDAKIMQDKILQTFQLL